MDAKRYTMEPRVRVSGRAAREPAPRIGVPAGEAVSIREAILAMLRAAE